MKSNLILTIMSSLVIILNAEKNGPVVQLVRTLACHARGRRFEPVPGRHFFADMAQVVERILGKDEVGGSSPPISSKNTRIGICLFGYF